MIILNFYAIGKTIPENAVYIGRKNSAAGLEQSKFANPEPLAKGSSEQERQANLGRYRQWLVTQVKTGRISADDLLELKDKDLVCFCSPKACHGDVVKEAVGWAVKNQEALPAPDARKATPITP
jgi:hypothetical protein